MKPARHMVLTAGLLLLGTWFLVHYDRLFKGDDDSLIRLVLGGVFALLIVLRRKPSTTPVGPRWLMPVAAVAGALSVVAGIIVPVHMLEWSGVLLLLLACLLWSMPPKVWRDALLSMLVLYWVHPLPGQVFGWLQLSMQVMAVRISEWALQVVNVRVWADGIMLRTGYQNFLVPEVCSGMRAAVTVFLSTLGLCLLLRVKWYMTGFFTVVGLAQVLLLNVARVSYMVVWAPRMDPEWADNFLHDSLGSFLLFSVVLIQIEVGMWHRWSTRRRVLKEGIAKGELEPPNKASIIPGALRYLVQYGAIAVIVLGVAGAVALAGYRSRPAHRTQMVREVIEELIDSSPEAAGRAVSQMLARDPRDRGFRGMQVRVDLQLGEPERALEQLASLEAEAPLSLHQNVMNAWGLLQTGRRIEAREIITGLPQSSWPIPGVAMLRAELAAFEGDPAAAAEAVVLAARSRFMLPRVRRLFPFLAMHEMWHTIVEADRDLTYTSIPSALISIQAGLRTDNPRWAATALRRGLHSWPRDPQFLSSAFDLARIWRGSEWSDAYAELVRATLQDLTPDSLSQNIERAFELGRPGLAWILLARLRLIDPDDPALNFVVARYVPEWFRFRRRALGLSAQVPGEEIDLAPLVQQTAALAPFAAVWARVLPVKVQRLTVGHEAIRAAAIEACLDELARREARGELTRRLDILYPMALSMAGRSDAAHERLATAGSRHPELYARAQFQHAVLHDQAGEWDASYEAIWRYREAGGNPTIQSDMIRINALMNQNLGVCVMEVLRDARTRFPEARQPDMIEAAIWNAFGYHEDALFLVERAGARSDTELMFHLYRETGRLQGAQRLARSLGISFNAAAIPPENYRLHPAEWAVLARWPGIPDAAAREVLLAGLAARNTEASPFFGGLARLQSDWLRDGPDARLLDLETWRGVARSPVERIGALHTFALMALRYGQRERAEQAVREALAIAPRSAPLWRLLVQITGGEAQVIADARRQVPDDAELWLALLVTQVGEGETLPEAVEDSLAPRLERDRTPPGQLVRAGDFLLRNGHGEAAARIARAVIPQARGLLAAQILGLRAALAIGDLQWAQDATVQGIEHSLDPGPFYRVLVQVKAAVGGEADNELVQALEYLNARERDQPGWADLLGRVYFFQGNMRRAARVFEAVTAGAGGPPLRTDTAVFAAEAARLQDRPDRARRLLEAAYARDPDNLSVVNNLAYLLAQDERTLDRALDMLPRLERLADNHPAALDTIATVHMRSGNLSAAQRYYERALRNLPDDAYGALEIRLNAAELELLAGRYAEARTRLLQIRRQTAGNELLDVRARRLMQELDARSPGR